MGSVRRRPRSGKVSLFGLLAALPGFKLMIDLRNVNIPWPDKGMGDGDYMHAFQKVVMPIALEFNPDLVISK